jgi:hypothetical protein
VTSEPAVAGVEQATHLSEFRVLAERLIEPLNTNGLSISEGGVLWQGSDLIDYLLRTIPNPF